MSTSPARVAYADPPYPGCAHLYRDHPDYAGEVDHAQLVHTLVTEYDGYCLHTSSVALADVLRLFQTAAGDMPRVMAWVKPFAAFKRNVSVAYAWEPVLVRSCRKPVVSGREVMRDWLSAPIALKRGLTGAKPERVCRWLFEVMGMHRDDTLVDLFPGTGVVSQAWESWRSQLSLLAEEQPPEPDDDAAEYARTLALALCPGCGGAGAAGCFGCDTCDSSGLVDQHGAAFDPPPPFDTWAPSQLVALCESSMERKGEK